MSYLNISKDGCARGEEVVNRGLLIAWLEDWSFRNCSPLGRALLLFGSIHENMFLRKRKAMRLFLQIIPVGDGLAAYHKAKR